MLITAHPCNHCTSIGQRFLLTLFIVLAILFALAAYGYFTGRWEDDENNVHIFGLASAESHAAEPETCMDAETRERIRAIFFDAIDEGLRQHIMHVFQVWMKDDRGQPDRAAVGVRQGVRAYIGSRAAAMKWNPPLCAN